MWGGLQKTIDFKEMQLFCFVDDFTTSTTYRLYFQFILEFIFMGGGGANDPKNYKENP